MAQAQIFYPVIALVLFTLAVGVALAKARVRAVREGLSPAYFHFNRGAKPPDYLLQVTHHYDNLFETPVLFYLGCIIAYVAQLTDIWLVGLAWVYVVTRLAHAWVHMGENRLLLRRRVFFASYAALSALWVVLTFRLI